MKFMAPDTQPCHMHNLLCRVIRHKLPSRECPLSERHSLSTLDEWNCHVMSVRVQIPTNYEPLIEKGMQRGIDPRHA